MSCACAFYHEYRDIQFVIHGDDFTYLGCDEDLDWLQTEIVKEFEIKIRGRLGPEKHDAKNMRILNRCVEWREDGIYYEADPRHAEMIAKEMCDAKSTATVSTAGVKEQNDEDTNKY